MAGKPIGRILRAIAKHLDFEEPVWNSERRMQWERVKSDPFKSLIGTVLSQRTRDENTAKASEQLFSRYSNSQKLAKAPLQEIRKLIKPAGFYNVKAKRIRDISRLLVEKYSGRVPDDMDELCSIPGVGRKTAGCVLIYSFGKSAIPVDTHVHRVSNRIGFVKTNTPEKTEQALMKVVPKRYWLVVNELFVRFGKKVCRPVGPKHEECPVGEYCDFYKNLKQS